MRYKLQEQVSENRWALREHYDRGRLVFDDLLDAEAWLSYLRLVEPHREFRVVDAADGGRVVDEMPDDDGMPDEAPVRFADAPNAPVVIWKPKRKGKERANER